LCPLGVVLIKGVLVCFEFLSEAAAAAAAAFFFLDPSPHCGFSFFFFLSPPLASFLRAFLDNFFSSFKTFLGGSGSGTESGM